MNWAGLAAFFCYFLLLLLFGLYFHRKQTSSTEFIMGNRSLNYWLVALSAHASDMSAWLFMAFPMTIFVFGLSRSGIAIGLLGGMFLNWQFVAPKLRTMTEKYQCYTLSSFFEKRFDDQSGLIRLLSAVMLIIFLTHYLSAGLIAMGMVFESVFQLHYLIGVGVALVVAVIYTLYGGYVTVAWTDLFQGVFLLAVIVFVPFLAYTKIDGGWSTISWIAEQKGISISPFSIIYGNSLYALVALALGWGLGYFGMPHILTKFMGLRDPKEMYKSKWVGMSWQILALLAAIGVGIIGIAFFPGGLENPELVFVEMVKGLFHPFIAGFILCGILAANMSTMDSQILVVASVISEDLYKRWFRTGASSKELLKISRIAVIGVAIVAMFLALNKSATILDTVLYSWSGLGASFGPLVIMSLYYEKATKQGAVAGIVTGGVTVLLWPMLNPFLSGYDVPPLIPGFFASLAAIYWFSKLIPQQEWVAE